MRRLTKRFPALLMVGGLALVGAACDDTGTTDDPAVEDPATDDPLAPTDEGTDPLAPTETET